MLLNTLKVQKIDALTLHYNFTKQSVKDTKDKQETNNVKKHYFPMNNYIPVLHNLLEQSRKKSDGDQIVINHIPFQKMMFQTQKQIAQIFPNVKCISINNCDLRTLENFPFLKNLQSLDVSNNSLQGSFQFLVKNKRLQYINAAHNYISNLEKLAPLRRLKGISLYIKQNTICEKDGFSQKIKQYNIKLLKQAKVLVQQAKAINLVKDQNQIIEVKQKKQSYDRLQIDQRIREIRQERRNARQRQRQLLQMRRNRQLIRPRDQERVQHNFRKRWDKMINIEEQQPSFRSSRLINQFLRPPRMMAPISNATEIIDHNRNPPAAVINGSANRLSGRPNDVFALRQDLALMQDLAQLRRLQMNSTQRNANHFSPTWRNLERRRQGLASLIQNSSSDSNLNNVNRNINQYQSSESESESIKQLNQNEQDDQNNQNQNDDDDGDGDGDEENENEDDVENEDLLQDPQQNIQDEEQEEQQEQRQDLMPIFLERPGNIFQIDNIFNIGNDAFIIADHNDNLNDRNMLEVQQFENIYNMFDRDQNDSVNDQPQDQEPQQ